MTVVASDKGRRGGGQGGLKLCIKCLKIIFTSECVLLLFTSLKVHLLLGLGEGSMEVFVTFC